MRFRITNISNRKAASAASAYQMAEQTPRNWQIDLPHARIQAVASRASAMSIIWKKRDRHAVHYFLSILADFDCD